MRTFTFYPPGYFKKHPHLDKRKKSFGPKPIAGARINWKAPEHEKMTVDMERDYPRDDLGVPIAGAEKILVVDKRPTIMVPPRPTYIGFK